jgi:hypothetical protein
MSPQEVIVPVVFFFAVVAIWGGYLLTRHRERMTMIEKGLKSDEIKSLYARGESPTNPLSSLKWGMIFVGAGLAILLGMWLHQTYYVQEGVYPGLIALFGGIGLVIFYFIARRKTAA